MACMARFSWPRFAWVKRGPGLMVSPGQFAGHAVFPRGILSYRYRWSRYRRSRSRPAQTVPEESPRAAPTPPLSLPYSTQKLRNLLIQAKSHGVSPQRSESECDRGIGSRSMTHLSRFFCRDEKLFAQEKKLSGSHLLFEEKVGEI